MNVRRWRPRGHGDGRCAVGVADISTISKLSSIFRSIFAPNVGVAVCVNSLLAALRSTDQARSASGEEQPRRGAVEGHEGPAGPNERNRNREKHPHSGRSKLRARPSAGMTFG